MELGVKAAHGATNTRWPGASAIVGDIGYQIAAGGRAGPRELVAFKYGQHCEDESGTSVPTGRPDRYQKSTK